MVKGDKSQIVSFNEILDVKFDLMNREMICGNFITKTLERYSKSLKCEMNELFIIIHLEPSDDEEELVKLHLYQKQMLVEEIELEKILA